MFSGIPGRCLSGNAQAQSLSLSSRPPTQGPQFSQSLGRTLTLPAVWGQFSEVFWRTVAPWWLNGRIHGLMEYKGSSRLHTPQDLGTGTPHTRLLSHASGGQHRYCREHDGSHIHVLGTCVNCASYDPTDRIRHGMGNGGWETLESVPVTDYPVRSQRTHKGSP